MWLELALSDTLAEPCLLAAQTSPDGFKEAAESYAETLTVSMYQKQGMQMGGDGVIAEGKKYYGYVQILLDIYFYCRACAYT